MGAANLPQESRAADGEWIDQFARALTAHRQRARNLLRAERQRLERVEQLYRQLRAWAERSPEQGETLAALEQRDDQLAEARRQLESVQSELAEARRRAAAARRPASEQGHAPLDWESQKQRLLAELESDGGPRDAAERTDMPDGERASPDGSGWTNDRIVAEMAAEIQRLERLLAERQAGDPIEAIVDQDEVVQEERQKLQALQQQWQEKLRQSEVEISIERAKLARERSALEEKLQRLQSQQARDNPDGSGPPESTDGKPGRAGRWLSRLGLDGD